MAGFTSVAMLAGGLIAGKLLGGRGKKEAAQPLAPAPTNANADAIESTPTPPAANPAATEDAARKAAEVTRKRGAAGSWAKPLAPRSSTMPATPRLAPRRLAGS